MRELLLDIWAFGEASALVRPALALLRQHSHDYSV